MLGSRSIHARSRIAGSIGVVRERNLPGVDGRMVEDRSGNRRNASAHGSSVVVWRLVRLPQQ